MVWIVWDSQRYEKHGSKDPPLQERSQDHSQELLCYTEAELELELEGELDGAGAADLVEGVEAAAGTTGA